MAKACWFCGFVNEAIPDNFFGDFNCKECGVQNSVYNPDEADPEIKKEEEQMINYEDEKYQGKFVYMPLMGEEAEFDIVEISEVKSDNPKFNFSEKVPVMANGEQVVDDDGEPVFKVKDLGYHIEAKLKSGKILSVTSMSTFRQVFKKYEIQDGDNIRVFHKDKGVWEVEKL